jgi:hypothetical protein
VQVPLGHVGHGDDEFPVMYTRDESGMFVLVVPAVRSAVPPASVWMTLTTQVLSPAFTIGSGAAKKQLASSAQKPTWPPHCESAVQSMPVLVEPMQCAVGPAPWVQFRSLPVCAWVVAVSSAALLGPWMLKRLVAPSGVAPGGTAVAPPPPM